MARRHYNLPPLSTLASFETAARHLSFKSAANELNVTPGAVSHQIKALETELGVVLFERKHRAVELTESGKMLFSVLERGFLDISQVLSYLRKVEQDVSLSIASTTSMSSLWLTPRISEFWRHHADIPVNQIVSDGPARAGELTDLRIQYGRPDTQNTVHTELFRDTLIPMCSPELAQQTTDTSLKALARMTLIHLDAESSKWTTWRDWFTTVGYTGEIAQGRRVNNYMIALQAAQDGAGIVLGWEKLVRPLLDKGRLVPLGSTRITSAESFYISSAPDDTISPSTRIFKNWLLDNI
jgi:DNA-binding transcriptional LysR family regulator